MKAYDLDEMKKLFRLSADGSLQRYYDPVYGQEKQGWITVDNAPSPKGYFRVKGANRRTLQVHNIVWMLFNNSVIPDGLMVDHIDRVKTNNIPSNLRLVTSRRNRLNSGPVLKNDGRCTLYDNHCKAWRTSFAKGGERSTFGPFSTEQDAAKVRDLAVSMESAFTTGAEFKALVEREAALLGIHVEYKFKNKGYAPLLCKETGKFIINAWLNSKRMYIGKVFDLAYATKVCEKMSQLRNTHGDAVACSYALAVYRKIRTFDGEGVAKTRKPEEAIIYSR